MQRLLMFPTNLPYRCTVSSPVPSHGDARRQMPATVPVSVQQGQRTPVRRSRVAPGLTALLVAIIAAVLLGATWWFFVETRDGQLLDRAALNGASYGQGALWRVAEQVLQVVSVTFIVLGLGAAMLIALVRRRWGLAVQVAILVIGANVTTQLLKYQVLERPDLGVHTRMENSLPSGHTTVAGSVSMALVMVVPRRLRPLVAALGALYTGATGVSTLIGQWHRPSDVVAAVMVILLWTGLVCAVTPRTALDRPGKPGAISTAMVATALGMIAAVSGGFAFAVLRGAPVPGLNAAMAQSADNRAYFGMVALVMATVAVAFLGGLLTRQATSRG